MLKIFRLLIDLIQKPDFRAVFILKHFKSSDVHQTTPMTGVNRYPEIFATLRQIAINNPKILSFGCSTGEEVFTLRHYFSDSIIIGAEINEHSLKICKERNDNANNIFIKSKPENINKYAQFDIVLCMAVLQRTPHLIIEQNIKDISKIYPFDKFEKQIIELDKYVKLDGLLVVKHAQYLFTDTKIAQKYIAIETISPSHDTSYIFDRNGILVDSLRATKFIFRKISD